MAKRSAGILLYRMRNKVPEVLLVHPGGPFWQNKDEGAWSIPKGEYAEDEDPLEAAKREMEEELGKKARGELKPLQPVRLKSGKIISAWYCHDDFDPEHLKSNLFEMEWPVKSGRMQSFPEVDKAEWFDFQTARKKINAGQVPFIDELEMNLKRV
jgi:predicted NUDIX family NTP pyrophosphohydrolase